MLLGVGVLDAGALVAVAGFDAGMLLCVGVFDGSEKYTPGYKLLDESVAENVTIPSSCARCPFNAGSVQLASIMYVPIELTENAHPWK
jgi:hypothetical protein